jgi:hypothetical protein
MFILVVWAGRVCDAPIVALRPFRAVETVPAIGAPAEAGKDEGQQHDYQNYGFHCDLLSPFSGGFAGGVSSNLAERPFDDQVAVLAAIDYSASRSNKLLGNAHVKRIGRGLGVAVLGFETPAGGDHPGAQADGYSPAKLACVGIGPKRFPVQVVLFGIPQPGLVSLHRLPYLQIQHFLPPVPLLPGVPCFPLAGGFRFYQITP